MRPGQREGSAEPVCLSERERISEFPLERLLSSPRLPPRAVGLQKSSRKATARDRWPLRRGGSGHQGVLMHTVLGLRQLQDEAAHGKCAKDENGWHHHPRCANVRWPRGKRETGEGVRERKGHSAWTTNKGVGSEERVIQSRYPRSNYNRRSI